jgi:SAM-dependent MidA family methyltransferase
MLLIRKICKLSPIFLEYSSFEICQSRTNFAQAQSANWQASAKLVRDQHSNLSQANETYLNQAVFSKMTV